MFKTVLISAIAMFSVSSLAMVDLKNANYSDAWIDIQVPGGGYDLKITRAYNSRTLFNGMFGFGWCSEFETSIEITPEGNLILTECGAGLETLYIAPNFSEKDIDKTVKELISKIKMENPSNPPAYFTDLETRLRSDTPLRFEYASKYGLSRQVADNTKFLANGRGPDFIEKKGTNFVRTNPEGSIQKFLLDGRLEKVFDRNGNYLAFSFEKKLLREVTDNSGRKLTFTHDPSTGKVKSVVGPGKLRAEYKYSNRNDLTFARTAAGNTYNYDYDDLHNLVKTKFPNGKTKEMAYRKDKDWIISYKDLDGCTEAYDYVVSKDDQKNHFWATVVKTCQNKTVLNAKYEFWFKAKDDRTGRFLARSKTTENDVSTDVAYNDFGRPVSINKNGKTSKFEYYPSGLLSKRTDPDGVTTALYYDNTFKKVNKVVRAGKSSEFFYDSKGNLISAKNSEGQLVNIKYDPRGRIATIEDQAKRRINIKYEERFGKPNLIEREGIGSISVTYTNSGDIQKVSSAAGSNVATQVATTFNNLLDLIQPAGVSLSL